jgi:hypothetical protein
MAYEWFLQHPQDEVALQYPVWQSKRPFRIWPDAAVSPARQFLEIPLIALDSNIKTLFSHIQVTDIISTVELGMCHLCHRHRDIITGWEVIESRRFLSYTGLELGWWNVIIPCPLCVGLDYSMECLKQGPQGGQHESASEIPYAEYVAWLDARKKELGYDVDG